MIFGREPVLISQMLFAILALGVGFGLNITTEQMGLIMGAAAAVMGVITRQMVTPYPVDPHVLENTKAIRR